MAHFAKVTADGLVLEVLVVGNGDAPTEEAGIEFLGKLFGDISPCAWVQTSYSNSIRKNFAGVGFTYDAGRDAFIAPRPFDSWLLDEATCRWVAPAAMPTEGGRYTWSEEAGAWVAQ